MSIDLWMRREIAVALCVTSFALGLIVGVVAGLVIAGLL